MFKNIENFYATNHYRLIADKSEGSLRPGKSFTKDVENCIRKFSDFYKSTGFTKINEERLVSIIGGVDTNTRSQNLRVMREFRFLVELDAIDEDGMYFQLTDSFKDLIASGETQKEYILNTLKSISSLEDLTMYLNLLICTLREAYLYGQVMLFKDSYDKFKSDVPDLAKRNEYRQRIYNVYGYSGRDKQITDDVYSPNLSYMSRAELENLGLLIMTTEKIDNMNNLVLTTKGYELLCCIEKNLSPEDSEETEEENIQEICYNTGYQSPFARNRILFGAPGTGKSYSLNQQIEKIVPCGDDGKVIDEYFERVTFYPSYTYSQFVGAYKPKPKKVLETNILGNEVEKEIISYEFVPGPFSRVLAKALKLKKDGRTENCMLVIEEINRANAAAVFGDIFQLLDRKPEGSSEYSIETSEEMRAFLAKELDDPEKDCAKITIPSNLFIWATMNSADQGVTPMDTAFKRRWDFEYIGIDAGEFAQPYLNAPVRIGGIVTSWNKIRKEINRLLQTPNIKLSEDKLIGPFFLSENVFVDLECLNEQKVVEESHGEAVLEELAAEVAATEEVTGNTVVSMTTENKVFTDALKNKVLMYLFEDAVKSKKSQLFEATTYSQLCEDFDLEGLKVFKGIMEANLILREVTLDNDNKSIEVEESESTSEEGTVFK